VAEAQVTATTLRATTTRAGPDVTAAIAQLRATADNLASTSARIDALVARHEQDLDRFADQGLGDLSALVHESRNSAAEISALARTLQDDPSRLLYEPVHRTVKIPP
jgi:hypothetical protein